ncbi:MAG: DUF4157 domain-containing protein [Gemmatimonadetes bacterium]|nr:DUF4157 domain-containing protein [Gemmatimonadota bacterium]
MTLIGRAVDLVFGRRIEPPKHLPAEAVPEGVVLREGRLVPAIGGMLARMRGPAAAVTLRRTIVVYPGVRLTERLLAHELAHVRQWQADPLFPVRYSVETLRRGYRGNRYERQAREEETSPTHSRGPEKTL